MTEPVKTKVYYDASCTLCQVSARFLESGPSPESYDLLNVHTAPLPEGLTKEAMLEEIYVQTPDGALVQGADAVIILMKTRWYLRPLAWIASLPGCILLARALYRVVARNRHRFFSSHTS